MEIHLVWLDQRKEHCDGRDIRLRDAVWGNVVWLEKIVAADPDCPGPVLDSTIVINASLVKPD